MIKVICVVGARPNFMKIAPIIEEIKKHEDMEDMEYILVHTGQHYNKEMSAVFFDDLKLPRPGVYLGVGSGSHAEQTARIMLAFEKVLVQEKTDLVIVVGDVNSTIACSLVAVKLQIKVAHVEAGLRSFNWEMPEEINRVLTDRIADFLFTTERDANKNLEKEGIPNEKIFFVGNVMIDTLMKNRKKAEEKSTILKKLGLEKDKYAAMTLHRAEIVDKKEALANILSAIDRIQEHIKLVYPIHPRTNKRIKEFGFEKILDKMKNLIVIDPLGYLDFLKLMSNSKFVLTDSGGIQEETTVLGIPCLTLRNETERPVTVEQGTNIIVGTDKERIIEESMKILQGKRKRGEIPELWDGKAAERIVDILANTSKKWSNSAM